MARRLILAFVAGALTSLVSVGLVAGPAAPGAAARALAAPPALKATLPNPALWAGYKARFIAPDGRVIDDGNHGISHSEGQGYAMLLAVAADDRATFERVWAWTRAELMIRPDGLAAWRWEPGKTPAVTDRNNASDGDILIAWALAEAADAWGEAAHRAAARALARTIGRTLLVPVGPSTMLLPAREGFGAAERRDGPVVNLSYWVFPALPHLKGLAPEFAWDALVVSGLSLATTARFGTPALPTDWIALGDASGKPRPADGFPPAFGYNAVRVPLYLAWARAGQRGHLAPYAAAWDTGAMAVVDLVADRPVEPFIGPGYRSVAALVRCALDGTRLPDDLRGADIELYYPTTLRALALIAVRQRYPECW